MKLLIGIYLTLASFKLFFESIYTYKVVLNSYIFNTVKSPILKFTFCISIVSLIYFILQYRWVYVGLSENFTDYDELLWSISEGIMIFIFANICSIFRKLSKFK